MPRFSEMPVRAPTRLLLAYLLGASCGGSCLVLLLALLKWLAGARPPEPELTLVIGPVREKDT